MTLIFSFGIWALTGLPRNVVAFTRMIAAALYVVRPEHWQLNTARLSRIGKAFRRFR